MDQNPNNTLYNPKNSVYFNKPQEGEYSSIYTHGAHTKNNEQGGYNSQGQGYQGNSSNIRAANYNPRKRLIVNKAYRNGTKKGGASGSGHSSGHGYNSNQSNHAQLHGNQHLNSNSRGKNHNSHQYNHAHGQNHAHVHHNIYHNAHYNHSSHGNHGSYQHRDNNQLSSHSGMHMGHQTHQGHQLHQSHVGHQGQVQSQTTKNSQQAYFNKIMNKIKFVNKYEKVYDFSNYNTFSNLNLKFLKQNYKIKEFNQEYDEHKRLSLDLTSKYDEMRTRMRSQSMNSANRIPVGPGMEAAMGMGVGPGMGGGLGYQNITSQDYQQMKGLMPPHHFDSQRDIGDGDMDYINMNMNMNNPYYDNMKNLQYLVKDDSAIEECLKTGQYLKGEIRINKCHTHGYITVNGIDNDILIRGNRNLNQSLHLDEVIVELFPIVYWKPLFNKKIKKTSRLEDEKMNSDYDTEREDTARGLEESGGPGYEYDAIGGEIKESFENIEERFKFINKNYNLRPEGRIVKIVKSLNMDKSQVATIECERNHKLIFAKPMDENIPKIFIKMKKFRRIEFINKLDSGEAFKNKYFMVKIVGWALNFKCPKGIIVNEIGNSGDIDVETEVLLKTYEVEDVPYPPQVMEELKEYQNYMIPKEIINSRRDLRNDIIFTIDPTKSKDLDDAMSIKLINEEKKLYEIGVHIADPSYFIENDSTLDKLAMQRATTVYLVHKNIPMLPRVLSENLCSLLPRIDRLAISCFFRVYEDGTDDTDFKPKLSLSVINSTAKWNYDLVGRILKGDNITYSDLTPDEKPVTEEIFEQMKKSVFSINKICKNIRKKRIESGALVIENQDVEFELSDNNYPIAFKIKERGDANYLVEECMLKANKITAEFLYENLKSAAIVRRHAFLNDNKFVEITRYMINNKFNFEFQDPKSLNDFLMQLKETSYTKYTCLQLKLKNFMQRAEYTYCGDQKPEELKHTALNFDLYTHFTSPIRRYPDLIVHRLIKYVLNGYTEENVREKLKNVSEKVVNGFNEKYINSKNISHKSKRMFHSLFLKSQFVNKIYKAFIVDIVNKNQAKNKKGMPSELAIIIVTFYIPELCLEIEWKKEDQEFLNNFVYNQNDNSIIIEVPVEDRFKTKTFKVFDEADVAVYCIDSIPAEIKCNIVLTDQKEREKTANIATTSVAYSPIPNVASVIPISVFTQPEFETQDQANRVPTVLTETSKTTEVIQIKEKVEEIKNLEIVDKQAIPEAPSITKQPEETSCSTNEKTIISNVVDNDFKNVTTNVLPHNFTNLISGNVVHTTIDVFNDESITQSLQSLHMNTNKPQDKEQVCSLSKIEQHTLPAEEEQKEPISTLLPIPSVSSVNFENANHNHSFHLAGDSQQQSITETTEVKEVIETLQPSPELSITEPTTLQGLKNKDV